MALFDLSTCPSCHRLIPDDPFPPSCRNVKAVSVESFVLAANIVRYPAGALFSSESVKLVSDLVQQDKPQLVLDMEPFFKTGPPPQEEVLGALKDDILPSTTVLCATVREAKALLDNAGIHIDYPQSMQDVQTMGQAVQKLGPEYVVMKREILGENDGMTTLHYVLCGGAEPQMVTCRFKNPKGFFGVSYFIPSTYQSSIHHKLRKEI